MPRAKPDVPAWKRGGRPRINPPANVVSLAEQYARTNPTRKDLASKFGVSEQVFARWLSENQNIQLAIDSARTEETEKLFKKIREKADGGNIQAADRWLATFRPDLVDKGAKVNLSVSQTNVRITPQPKNLDAFVKETGNVIEATAQVVGEKSLYDRLFGHLEPEAPGGDAAIPTKGRS